MKDGQNTASPGPIPQAISGSTMASVPLAQDRACFALPNAARSASKVRTGGPMMKAPDSTTAIIASVMRGPIRRRWAFRSMKAMDMPGSPRV